MYHSVINSPDVALSSGLKFGRLPCSLGKTAQRELAQTSSVVVAAENQECGSKEKERAKPFSNVLSWGCFTEPTCLSKQNLAVPKAVAYIGL